MADSSFFIYIEKWFLKRLKQVSSTTTIHREREINKKERRRGEGGKRSMQTRHEVRRLERVAESGFAIRRDVYSAYLASLECEFNKVNKSF